jgi:FxsC-like protein
MSDRYGPAPSTTRPAVATPPRFFLSYARSDDDPHVEHFFKDLCAEVRVRAGLPSTAEVGFFDTHSIEIGATWSSELVRALSECCTFLALCSPRYFVSEMCGREWQIFHDRIERFGRTTGTCPPLLMPVLWLPLRAIPDPVGRLQYDNEVFSEAYRRSGLRQLMRLQRNHDDYLDALTVLADRIVENAASPVLPPVPDHSTIDFERVPSAFHRVAPHTGPAPGQAAPAAPRPDHVYFVVAAPDRQEASTVRRNVEFYGDGSVDWAPYLPALPDSLASFARSVAEKRGLASDVLLVSAPGTLDEAAAASSIVVLLVDPWAPQIETYRLALADHEERSPAAAAMVPRNYQDPETYDNWGRLSNELQRVFVSKLSTGDATVYRSDNLNHRTFGEDLQVVLEKARNRIFARPRPPGAERTPPQRHRPILEGP